MLNCILGVSSINFIYVAAAVLNYICLELSWFSCPLALGWIDPRFTMNIRFSSLSQPSDPLKEKEFLIQMLACHCFMSHTPYNRAASGRES